MQKLHYFIRVDGELFEIQPLTHASKENPSVRALIIRTGKIQRVSATEIITSY